MPPLPARPLLDEERLRIMKRNSRILIIIGSIGVIELVFLARIIKLGSFHSIMEAVSVFAFMFLPFVLLSVPFFRGIRALFFIRMIRRYAAFWEEDEDGFIYLTDMKNRFHRPLFLIKRQIRFMLKKKALNEVQLEETLGLVLLGGQFEGKWRAPVYLNERKIEEVRKSFTAWLFFSLLFIYYFLAVGYVMAQDYPIFVAGGIAGALLAFLYCEYERQILKRCAVYNKVFEGLEDDRISLSDVAKQVKGIHPWRIEKDLRWAIARGCIRHCYVNSATKTVELSDIQGGYAAYAALTCTHCGRSQKIRFGRIGQCEYCSSMIAAPTTTVRPLIDAKYVDYGSVKDFLDDEKVKKRNNAAGVLFAIAGFLAFTLLLYFALMQDSGYEGWGSMVLVFGVPGLACLLAGLSVRSRTKYGVLLANLFPQVDEQAISLEELAQRSGATVQQTKDVVQRFSNSGLLLKCMVEEGHVKLLDEAHKKKAYYQGACPNCGGEIRLKRGLVTVCPYCGSYLDDNGALEGSGAGRVGQAKSIVIIHDLGMNKAQVMSYLKELTRMPLKDLLTIADSLPAEVAKTTPAGAEKIELKLREMGASVEVRGKSETV